MDVIYWAQDWLIRGQIWVSQSNCAFSSYIQCCLLAWCYSFHYHGQGKQQRLIFPWPSRLSLQSTFCITGAELLFEKCYGNTQHSDLVLSVTHSPSGTVSDTVCVSAAGEANWSVRENDFGMESINFFNVDKGVCQTGRYCVLWQQEYN